MEKQRKKQEQKGGDSKKKEVPELEHDVTIMMSDPMKMRLPAGATLKDLLVQVQEELKKQGKELDLKNYEIMINNRSVGEGENPILIRASVVSLTNKNIVGGI